MLAEKNMRLPVLSDLDHLQSPKPTQILSLLSDWLLCVLRDRQQQQISDQHTNTNESFISQYVVQKEEKKQIWNNLFVSL